MLNKKDLQAIKGVVDKSVKTIVDDSVKTIVDDSVKTIVDDSVKTIVDKSVDSLAVIVKKEFEKAAAERKDMKRDIEEIKMKFAYTAWQIDLEEVKKRVAVLEKKNGVKH